MSNMANRRFSAIIADDEPLICDLLKKLIHWDELQLQLVTTVNDGRNLLRAVHEYSPDIVITDICMPEMSGIDLIRQIREQGIACRFIIVSGYRQFEYAHNALRYDVDGYLLKPINGDELNENLKKTVNSLRTSVETLTPANDQAGFRRLLMDHILNNAANPNALRIEQINREFNTNFREGAFRFAMIKLDIREYSGDTTINALTLTENIAHAIVQRIESIGAVILYCCSIDSISMLLNYDPDQESILRSCLRDGFDIGMHFTDLFINLQMTMGIGNRFTSLDGCLRSFKEASCALWCRIVLPDRPIIAFESLNLADHIFERPGLLDHQKKMLAAIDNLDESLFARMAGELTGGMYDCNHAARIGIMLESMCTPFAEKLSALFGKPDNVHYLRSEFLHGLSSAYSPKELDRTFFKPIGELIRQLRIESDQRAKKPIRQAITYMEENYSKPLRLDDVAAQVYLSPHYFYSLFVSEIGQSFSDYLIGIRMEAAKQLLRESHLSIGEIAGQVGYQDSRYFSRLFMQKVGIKPKEYRKIYG